MKAMKSLKPFTIEYDSDWECLFIKEPCKHLMPAHREATLAACDTVQEAYQWLANHYYIEFAPA